MKPDDLNKYLEFARSIAYEAGQITLEYYQKTLNPDTKLDGSPVTIADRRSEETIRGAIEFSGLSFSYDGRPVLQDISVRIEPGQTAAIVGPTGSGKSTLVNLLPRLFEPPRGTVFLDGIDVRCTHDAVDPDPLRSDGARVEEALTTDLFRSV